jgi:hypothetical protein
MRTEDGFEIMQGGTPNISATQEPPKIEPKPVNAVVVQIDEKGLFSFRTQQELANAAAIAIKTMLAPDHLRKEGVNAVASALVLCKQYNLPQKAMNQMAYIKGKLTCFGSLVTALAERHPMYGEKKEFFVTEEFDEICFKNKNLRAVPWAAIVQIRKKGQEHWTEYFFSIDDARQAGLLTSTTKPDSGWIKYFKDLIMHKARSRGLRAEYASALEGIDYHEDIIETLIDVTPRDDAQKALDKLDELKSAHENGEQRKEN